MEKATTRRGALMSLAKATAGVTALGVACSVSQCTTPAHGATIDRGAWDRAFTKMTAAVKTEKAHAPIHDAAWEAWQKNKPTGDNIDLRRVAFMLSTADRHNLLHNDDLAQLHAKYVAEKGVTWFAPDPGAQIAKHKEVCDQIAKFRRDYAAVDARYRPELDRGDELSQAAYDAMWALFALPAPDLAALHWKLEHLFGDSASDDGDGAENWAPRVMANLMADVRRLMPKEA